MPRTVPIEAPQPSQLLIDVEKLRGVLEWFDPEEPVYDPIPVLPAARLPTVDGLDPETPVVTDGHTRALAASLCGHDTLRVVDDPDAEELNLAVYARCLEWCLEAGVERPSDLAGRVVSSERYEEEWVGRCHDLPCYEAAPE